MSDTIGKVEKSLTSLIDSANAILKQASEAKELSAECTQLSQERARLASEIADLQSAKGAAAKEAHAAEIKLYQVREQLSDVEGRLDMTRRDAALMRREILATAVR
jgi:hypothetical protein